MARRVEVELCILIGCISAFVYCNNISGIDRGHSKLSNGTLHIIEPILKIYLKKDTLKVMREDFFRDVSKYCCPSYTTCKNMWICIGFLKTATTMYVSTM